MTLQKDDLIIEFYQPLSMYKFYVDGIRYTQSEECDYHTFMNNRYLLSDLNYRVKYGLCGQRYNILYLKDRLDGYLDTWHTAWEQIYNYLNVCNTDDSCKNTEIFWIIDGTDLSYKEATEILNKISSIPKMKHANKIHIVSESIYNKNYKNLKIVMKRIKERKKYD